MVPYFVYYENTSLILHVSLGKVSGIKYSDISHNNTSKGNSGEQYEQYEKGVGYSTLAFWCMEKYISKTFQQSSLFC